MPSRIQRTIPTYTRLRAVSWYALQLAKASDKARLNNLMTSLTFDAFTLEAYLNHIGSIRIKFWGALKRKLSPREKLDVIATDLGFTPDFSRRPWQTFQAIFRLRDLLVHAETETVAIEGEFSIESGDTVPLPLASWEEFMTIAHGERFLDDTKAMVTELAIKAGFPPEEIFAKDKIEASTTESGRTSTPSEEPA